MMENNLANISEIGPGRAMLQQSRLEETFLQELQELNTNRSKFNRNPRIDNQAFTPSANDSNLDFSPLFRKTSFKHRDQRH
jgi:hypothetical protein